MAPTLIPRESHLHKMSMTIVFKSEEKHIMVKGITRRGSFVTHSNYEICMIIKFLLSHYVDNSWLSLWHCDLTLNDETKTLPNLGTRNYAIDGEEVHKYHKLKTSSCRETNRHVHHGCNIKVSFPLGVCATCHSCIRVLVCCCLFLCTIWVSIMRVSNFLIPCNETLILGWKLLWHEPPNHEIR
jgi:hypothetical protein